MTDSEIKERAEAEQNRITDLLLSAGVSEKRMKVLEPIIINTAWMQAKLEDAREAIKNSQVVISYDNGGGQKGIRENPLFKGYESLWRAYMSGMERILNSLPEESGKIKNDEMQKPQTMLEIVRQKKKKEA